MTFTLALPFRTGIKLALSWNGIELTVARVFGVLMCFQARRSGLPLWWREYPGHLGISAGRLDVIMWVGRDTRLDVD